MILATGKEEREWALQKILPLQRNDFLEVFRVMEGQPITVRLLDPPLHKFLPRGDGEVEQLARETLIGAPADGRAP